jgi:hypothetical protein
MQMPNQNAKFVSAVVAGVLAGANFIPALNHSAHAEDSCLAAPNGQTPHGSHWRYRVERGTKRHCWYLRSESDAQSAAATPSAPASVPAKPVAPKATATAQDSVANARAELPWPQQPATTPAPSGQSAPAVAAAPAPDLPTSDSGQSAAPATSTATTGDAADTSQSTMTSRWPDQPNANASDDSSATTDDSNASLPPLPATTPASPPAAAAPPPAATAPPVAAADAASTASKPPGSMSMLLTIMISALALAGLVGGAILRFSGRKRADDEEEFDIDRRPAWDVEHTDHPLPYPAAPYAAQPHPLAAARRPHQAHAQRPNIGMVRERRSVEPDDAIKEMLARLARSAQT